MGSIQELRKLYNEIAAKTANLQDELRQQVNGTPPLRGVIPLRGSGASACKVSLATIFETPTLNFSPSYYLQDVQNEAVCKYVLKDGLSLQQMVERVDKALDTHKVVYQGETITLNPHTIAALERLKEVLDE